MGHRVLQSRGQAKSLAEDSQVQVTTVPAVGMGDLGTACYARDRACMAAFGMLSWRYINGGRVVGRVNITRYSYGKKTFVCVNLPVAVDT